VVTYKSGDWKKRLIGAKFPTSRAHLEKLNVILGLAVFSSDPISSVAYASEAIMAVLIMLSVSHMWYTVPITIAIALLIWLVILSYNQTIVHYPDGGGVYKVAKDNLGTLPSLVAATALLLDYVLTAAVSVSAGIRAISSLVIAQWPSFTFVQDNVVIICIATLGGIAWMNLRGLKESGKIFAVPTYMFVMGVFGVLVWGLIRQSGLFGALPLPHYEVTEHAKASLEIPWWMLGWMFMRAFASGCTALTGVEAVSNGVPAFKSPAPRNAITTMRLMGLISTPLFIGISYFAIKMGVLPTEGGESVLSQMSRAIVGTGLWYNFVQTGTLFILVLAANTAFQDFPRLAAILAKDKFLPTWMSEQGDRLVYSIGIFALAIFASLFIVIFHADEIKMLPLYAIGVFLSFTISQVGMIFLWKKVSTLKKGETKDTGVTVLHYEPNWRINALYNYVGAPITFFVLIVLVVTKFTHGAWIVVVLIPVIVLILRAIHRHFLTVKENLSLDGITETDIRRPADIAFVPISDLNRASLLSIIYAVFISHNVYVVQVIGSDEQERRERTIKRFERWQGLTNGAKLVILDDDWRDWTAPLIEYMMEVRAAQCPDELISVVLSVFIPKWSIEELLHYRAERKLRRKLNKLDDSFVVISVPKFLRKRRDLVDVRTNGMSHESIKATDEVAL
jgi:amino acid transporter